MENVAGIVRGRLSESEIMTILVCYHSGTYRNFKEYYQNCIRGWLRHEFPAAVSYNRFVELHAPCVPQDDVVHKGPCLRQVYRRNVR